MFIEIQTVCSSIFSLFLSRILVVAFSSKYISMFRVTLNFYIATFQKKNVIRKSSFLNKESLCILW